MQGLISRIREKGVRDLLKCIQCGSCTSSCIVNMVDDSFNPRRIIGSIVKFNKLPKEDPWLCSSCSICVERCPQRVNPLSLLMALRVIKHEEGNAPPRRVIEFVEQIKKTGFAFPLRREASEKRRLLGLPEVEISENELSEVRKLLSEAGF